MKRIAVILFLSLVATTTAFADTIPVYTLTQGTVIVTPDVVFGSTVETWSFGGPNGVSINGIADNLNDPCMDFAPGGSSCNPSLTVNNSGTDQPNFGTFSGSNASILFAGMGLTITGSPFTVPNGTSLSSFNVTFPVLFSGTFSACVASSDPSFFGDCPAPGSPVFALFNVNGPGIASLSFTNIGPPGTTIWRITQGTYTLNPVPEPSKHHAFRDRSGRSNGKVPSSQKELTRREERANMRT